MVLGLLTTRGKIVVKQDYSTNELYSQSMIPTPDTAKPAAPRTFADKKWVGPVKLLHIIMFNISKIRPKSLLGPVKALKFLRCLRHNVNSWSPYDLITFRMAH